MVALTPRHATCDLSPKHLRTVLRDYAGSFSSLLEATCREIPYYPLYGSRLNLTSFTSAEMVSERRYILFTSSKLILTMTTLQRNPTSRTTSFGDLSNPSRFTWPICGSTHGNDDKYFQEYFCRSGVSNSSAKGKGVDDLEHMSILYTVCISIPKLQ